MDNQPPECVIVSSNRYNDLEPYCTRIYHEDPDLWDSIFPWEFPQHGTQEQEEECLRRFFSATEIKMQGFKFLKHVWYCIALFNLNQRVPAFTDWWLAKPSSIELLNDTKLHPFLLKEDAKPSTFFTGELPQYGERFLSVVVPYLQRSIKELLEKRAAEKAFVSTTTETIKAQQASREALGDSGPKTGQSVDSTGYIVRTTVSLPSPMDGPQRPSTIVPQSAPGLITAVESARPRVMSEEQRPRQEAQPHPPKRGNNGARRWSNRGNERFHTRPAPPPAAASEFNERNAYVYSPHTYGPASVPAYDHAHALSGAPPNFMPSQPQGQALGPMPPHIQYIPASFGHPSQNQHPNTRQDPPFAHVGQPIYFQNPFNDRSNAQFPDRGFNMEPERQYFQSPSNFRGKDRRNSQGSRGGKPRGHTNNRSRGSRGRNSFTLFDQPPPFAMQGVSKDPRQVRDFSSNAYSPKSRRGSVVNERNWRSCSDAPQVKQQHQSMMKENTVPGRAAEGFRHPQTPFIPRDRQAMHMSGLAGENVDYNAPTQSPALYDPTRAPTLHRQQPASLRTIDPSTLTFEEACDRDRIGKHCRFADSLIVMGAPKAMPDHSIFDFFNALGRVTSISRLSSHSFEKGTRTHDWIWINFASAKEARNCLLNKPNYWLDDELLRVEVPRKFWDINHPKTIFMEPGSATRPPEEFETVTQVSSILQRTFGSTPTTRATSVERPVTEGTESEDITPTPSGASTPKSKSKSKRHNKKKKDKDNLRKISLNVKADYSGRSYSGSAPSEADSAVTVVDDSTQAKAAQADLSDREISLDSIRIEQQRSGSAQNDIQTSSEPSYSPADVAETRLSIPPYLASGGVGWEDSLQPGSANTDVQTTSELSFTPTDDITTCLPGEPQPFRAPHKTTAPAQEASSTGVNNLQQDSRNQAPGDPNESAATPCKSDDEPLDDSFHTASGSPDSDEGTSGGKESSTHQAKVEAVGSPDLTNTPSSPESAVSPKTITRVHMPRLYMRNRPASGSSTSTVKPEALEPPQPSINAVSPALPTPAYFTAPNTPAMPVGQFNESEGVRRMSAVLEEGLKPDLTENEEEDGKTEQVETQEEVRPMSKPLVKEEGAQLESVKDEEQVTDLPKEKEEAKPESSSKNEQQKSKDEVKLDEQSKSEAQAAKKAAKAKGPAQTESFSFFARNREKKPKASKKGTWKSKPKPDSTSVADVASGNTSRAVSSTASPNLEAAVDVVEAATKNVENKGTARTDSKATELPVKKSNAKHSTGKEVAAEAPVAPQQETPSKRKVLGSLLGLFTGGQPSLSTSRTDKAPPSKTSLTDGKAQDRPPETGVKKPDNVGAKIVSADKIDAIEKQGTGQQVKSKPTFDSTGSGSGSGKLVDAIEHRENEPQKAQVGLGISNDGEPLLDAETKPKKKGNKKKKPKKKAAEGGEDDQQQSSTPISETKTVPGMFHFGKDDPASLELAIDNSPTGMRVALPASVHDETEEAEIEEGSDTSSRTASLEHGTPTSDLHSPRISCTGRKLPARPMDSPRLLEATQPSWKKKKQRAYSMRRSETPPESEAGPDDIWIIRPGAETSSPSDDDEDEDADAESRPKRYYMYVGAGLREDVTVSEVDSIEKAQQRAREEIAKSKEGVDVKEPEPLHD